MAKKKSETIKSLANQDKLTVQKSWPLVGLWKSGLSLAENKILDIYLSRIDSHNPEKRAVQFEKGEPEQILNVKKINNQQLKERLKNLMSNVVTIEDKDDKKGFRLITLFEEAIAEQDEYGLWQVKLECTQKAMKYIFNIEHIGYIRYKLRCITTISSRYTYIMFLYLEANRFRMSWEVPVATLKEILDCEKEETYKEFKRFNDRLLKRVQKEMHEKTECRYTYTPVKRGRTVVAIRFELEPLSPQIEQYDASPAELPSLDDDYLDQMDFFRDACRLGEQEPEFNVAEIEALLSVIYTIPEEKLPPNDDGLEFRRYTYLRQKYTAMCAYAARKKINSRFAYLKKSLEKDAGIS